MTARDKGARSAPHDEGHRWATIAQACEYSTLSRNTMNRLINNHYLSRQKVGRKTLVDLAELDEVIKTGVRL